MGDSLTIVGTVEKITTFNAKGGGLSLQIETPEEPDIARSLHANRQRIADITFEFRDSFADGDQEGDTGNLFEGEGE